MDKIFLNDLKVNAIIGIWEWERRLPQNIHIDLEMATDIRRAAESDAIEDTLDYKKVAKRVESFVIKSEFKLVETLAEGIAGIVLTEFDVPWVKVRVRKPGAIRSSRDVGVEIERSRAEA